MIQELFDFITQRWDFLLPLIYEHLQISAIAIVFATIVGVSIGILIAEKRKASSLTLGIISFLYTIPSISMLGFLIPVTGIGNTSAIIALSIYAPVSYTHLDVYKRQIHLSSFSSSRFTASVNSVFRLPSL